MCVKGAPEQRRASIVYCARVGRLNKGFDLPNLGSHDFTARPSFEPHRAFGAGSDPSAGSWGRRGSLLNDDGLSPIRRVGAQHPPDAWGRVSFLATPLSLSLSSGIDKFQPPPEWMWTRRTSWFARSAADAGQGLGSCRAAIRRGEDVTNEEVEALTPIRRRYAES